MNDTQDSALELWSRIWTPLFLLSGFSAPQSYCLNSRVLLGKHLAVMPRASNTPRIPAARPCGKGSLNLPSLCRQGGPQWRAMMPSVLPIPHGSPLPPTYYNCLLQPKMSPTAQPPSPQLYASPLSSLLLVPQHQCLCPPHPQVPGFMHDGFCLTLSPISSCAFYSRPPHHPHSSFQFKCCPHEMSLNSEDVVCNLITSW